MTRHEKLAGRLAKLEQTRQVFMEGVRRQLRSGAGWVNSKEGEWKISFGPPHCSSLGPKRRRERESRPGMIHTVHVPESWLEDVAAAGIAVVDDVLILGAMKARCEREGVEAWKVVTMHVAGRKVRPSLANFVVRFGGLTAWASDIETAFDEIQVHIRQELGFDWGVRFGKDG